MSSYTNSEHSKSIIFNLCVVTFEDDVHLLL